MSSCLPCYEVIGRGIGNGWPLSGKGYPRTSTEMSLSIPSASNEISDTTKNTTVSTSGRTGFTEDGVIRPGQHAEAFVALNRENLQTDFARGNGEYQALLARLIGIDGVSQSLFSTQEKDFGTGRENGPTKCRQASRGII
jgi:hypothetical protein